MNEKSKIKREIQELAIANRILVSNRAWAMAEIKTNEKMMKVLREKKATLQDD